jgi:hypothetical protein
MNELFRFLSIIVVWSAVALVMIAMFAAYAVLSLNYGGEVAVGLALILGTAAAYSTAKITQSGSPRVPEQQSASERSVKAKRGDRRRLERLIENLDENEVVELEELLLTRDQDVQS